MPWSPVRAWHLLALVTVLVRIDTGSGAPHFFPPSGTPPAAVAPPKHPLGDFFGPEDNRGFVATWEHEYHALGPTHLKMEQTAEQGGQAQWISPEEQRTRKLSYSCTSNADACAALTKLYASSHAPTGGYYENWMDGDPCNDGWYAVSCSGDEVVYYGENKYFSTALSNYLPTEFGLLTSLTALKIKENRCGGDNCMAGAIPTQFGKVQEALASQGS